MGDFIRCEGCVSEPGVCEMLFSRTNDEIEMVATLGSASTPDHLRGQFDEIRQRAGLPKPMEVDSEANMTIFAASRNRKVEQLTERLRLLGCTLSETEINLNLINS